MSDQSLQPVGVRFIADGLDNFTKSLGKASETVQGFGKTGSDSFSQFSRNISNFGKSTPLGQLNNLKGAIQGAAMAVPELGAAVAIGNLISGAFTGAVSSIIQTGMSIVAAGEQAATVMKNYVIQSTELASRFEQLTSIAELMGKEQGYSGDQVNGFIIAIRKQGIEANTAAQLVTELARANMNMADSTKLAKAAQDTATISGESSTNQLERLKYGIMTYNSETLRSAGIMINTQQAMATYAKTINKTAAALSPAEKQQAMLNAVLVEAAKVEGAYEASMNSGAKIMKSMERVINDIQIAIGQPFQDSFTNLARLMYEGGKALTKMLEPGGALYPILASLAGVVNVLSKALFDFFFQTIRIPKALDPTLKSAKNLTAGLHYEAAQWIKDITKFITDATGTFQGAIVRAFSWGVNLIVSISNGITYGLKTSLVGAMQGVSGFLAYWLQGHSPPRVAPQIDLWGTMAMQEYLKGFTQADFGILDNIQGVLSGALSSLTSAGMISSQTAGKTLYSLSQGFIKAIKSGTGFDALIKKTVKALGPYGEAIGNIIKKQLELKTATDNLLQAQKNLQNFYDKANKAQDDMTRIMNEYNQLVKEGASPEILAAKKAEFDLARKRRDQSIEEAKAAEQAVVDAQTNVQNTQEELGLQQQLLKTLEDLAAAKVQAETAPPSQKAAGGAPAGGIATPPDPPDAPPDPPKWLDMTFEDWLKTPEGMMYSLQKRLETAMEPLKALGQTWKDTFSDITTAFDTFINSPGVVAFTAWFETNKKTITDVLLAIGVSVALIMGLITLGIVIVLGVITVLIAAVLMGIGVIVAIVTAIIAVFGVVAYYIGYFGAALVDNLIQAYEWFGKMISDIWNMILVFGATIVTQIIFFIIGIVNYILSAWTNLWTMAWTIIVYYYEKIKQWLVDMGVTIMQNFAKVKLFVINKITETIASIRAKINEFIKFGTEIVEGIKKGITDAWKNLISTFNGLIAMLPEAVKKILGIASPSKAFSLLGRDMMRGLAEGILKNSILPTDALQVSMNRVMLNGGMVTPPASASSIANNAVYNNSNSYNYNVNANYSNSQSEGSIIQDLRIMQMLSTV